MDRPWRQEVVGVEEQRRREEEEEDEEEEDGEEARGRRCETWLVSVAAQIDNTINYATTHSVDRADYWGNLDPRISYDRHRKSINLI